MGKFLFGVLIGVAGCLAYQKYYKRSAPFKAYERYAIALGKGDCSGMRAAAEGSAREAVEGLCTPRTVAVFGRSYRIGSLARFLSELAPDSPGTKAVVERRSESETLGEDEALLQVVERRSVQGKAPSESSSSETRHLVRLKKIDGAWKVVEFSHPSLLGALMQVGLRGLASQGGGKAPDPKELEALKARLQKDLMQGASAYAELFRGLLEGPFAKGSD